MVVVRITLHGWRETTQAPPGCLLDRERRRSPSSLTVRLLAAAFIFEEITTGGQPCQMVPQLTSVLTRRHRGDDRAKEATLTIHRDCRHAKGPQALDPVLVFGEDACVHPWVGGSFSTTGRIEACLPPG